MPPSSLSIRCFFWAALLMAGAARADWGGSLALQSDARERGISYSDDRPRAQATVAYDGPAGWYGGALLTRMNFYPPRTSSLLQAYAGRVWSLTPELDGEAGLQFSHFDAIRRYDYAEAYVGLLGDRWSARLHASDDYYGTGLHSLYAEWNGHQPLTESLQLFAHAGLLGGWGRGQRDPGGRFRADLRLGAAWRVGLVELQLAGVWASRGGPSTWLPHERRGTVVLGASVAF
ncbi:MAG: hypothetical protein DI603_13445 [Roseateles depolymerans]|uniref:Cellulose biosynthesis protein BcsS n=1 Tax=Roseateles depolymerans TaxID=76731 RepID=A0A2W5DMF0_9BURK|nr:MAG: hypothetical protein DI603_13445 [Roseateles depolymerans]